MSDRNRPRAVRSQTVSDSQQRCQRPLSFMVQRDVLRLGPGQYQQILELTAKQRGQVRRVQQDLLSGAIGLGDVFQELFKYLAPMSPSDVPGDFGALALGFALYLWELSQADRLSPAPRTSRDT
jgi:hypothetical protein